MDDYLYCCKAMEDQFRIKCEQHGADCPDNVIQETSDGKWGLAAKNADYTFNFCPFCGTALPKNRIW